MKQPFVRQALEACPAARDAMLAVDRRYFCPRTPYVDAPQSISAEATISAPHMHAHALALAHGCVEGRIKRGLSVSSLRILDVGSGSGYLTAALAALFPNARCPIIGIDADPNLVAQARRNTDAMPGGHEMLETHRIRFVSGNGRLGFADLAPYDLIHVGAECGDEFPQNLVAQLAPDGCIIAPVSGEMVVARLDASTNTLIEEHTGVYVRFVPLVHDPDT